MHLVFLIGSVPSMVALGVLGGARQVSARLRDIITVGALGGLVGTIGYDLARVPFAMAGQRVFAPIESYGLLIADASASSGWTSTLGWLFHFSNGVTFGIAYAALAAGRHWGWGVLWGLLLETVAVTGPFADRYQISGNEYAIVIAYLGHVFYGAPLGRIVQRIDRLKGATQGPTPMLLAGLVLVVLGWHQPWSTPRPAEEAASLSTPGTEATVVEDDRFAPEWLRIDRDQCVLVDNRSENDYETPMGDVPARSRTRLCFDSPGVFRVRFGSRPYSGGFVYVEDG